MAGRQTTSFAITDPIVGALLSQRFSLLIAAVCVATVSGCQHMPGSQAMRQYQLESDRLVSEFRAQKKRAEDLEARNVQLEQRLAESEKLLARAQNGTNKRGGRNVGGPELMIGEARDAKPSVALSDSNSTRSSSGRASNSRGGLPEMSPGTNGRFTSSGPRDPISLGAQPPRDLTGDRNRESQWRPVYNSGK